MKLMLIAILTALSFAAYAQTSPDLQAAAIQALRSQRENALDQAAEYAARLQVVTKELNDLKAAKAEADKKQDIPK